MNERMGIALFVVLIAAAGCSGSMRRDEDAARAKIRMVGMTKEEVLGCMGPPKKKAVEGATEVWSYPSGDGHSQWSSGSYKTTDSYRPSHYTHTDNFGFLGGESEKRFCTVNVTMTNGVVKAVHYIGPSATNFYNENDQCGYAVVACAKQ
ncbi:MAG: hypothetical protein PHW76_05270 [Alphaproteobacteria bacterium]|nr:hypothetical protein [Alphaproteobacteria bacterium]